VFGPFFHASFLVRARSAEKLLRNENRDAKQMG
jgi:hypothetical protein